MVPMQISKLAALGVQRNPVASREPGTLLIMIPAERRKQRQPLDRELPEETTVLVERYLQEFPARFLTFQQRSQNLRKQNSAATSPMSGCEFPLTR